MYAKYSSRAMLRRVTALLLTLLFVCSGMALPPVSAAPEKVTPEALAGVVSGEKSLPMKIYGTAFEPMGSHFQMTVEGAKSDFDATPGAGTAANNWLFDVYYRPSGSSEDYDKITCDLKSPSCLYDWGNGNVIYRLYLEKTPFTRLKKTSYETVIVVRNGNGIKGYNDTLGFTWTEKVDDWYSEFTGEWPDYLSVDFSVPMYDKPFTYHLKEGDVPAFDGATFRPGYLFAGWESEGKVYTGSLPPVSGPVSYTAVYKEQSGAGDADGNGYLTVKDASRILQVLGGGNIALPETTGMLDGKEGVTVSDVTALLDRIKEGKTEAKDPAIAALEGKTALFLGDSITEATTTDSLHPCWSWAGRVANFYGMKSYKNASKSGASISTIRGANRVLAQLNNNKNGKYDFVILHGSTNDAWDSAPVGSMTADDCFDVSKFKTSTFAGGLEELFYYAKQYYPDAKIGYIINFRFNPNINAGRLNDMTEYIEVSKKICEKWEIPYVDLSTDEIYNKMQPGTPKNFADTHIHPNSYGYDILYPYVANFMAGM